MSIQQIISLLGIVRDDPVGVYRPPVAATTLALGDSAEFELTVLTPDRQPVPLSGIGCVLAIGGTTILGVVTGANTANFFLTSSQCTALGLGAQSMDLALFDGATPPNKTTVVVLTQLTITPALATAPGAPTIASISEATGVAGDVVTFRGTNFAGIQQVDFNGFVSLVVSVQDPTKLTAVVPAGVEGAGPVHIRTNTGTATGPTFTPQPTIASYSSPALYIGQTLTINGANFIEVTTVLFNGLAASSYVVVSETEITAAVPPGLTSAGPVTVTTSVGTATGPSFWYPLPSGPLALNLAPLAIPGTGLTTGPIDVSMLEDIQITEVANGQTSHHEMLFSFDGSNYWNQVTDSTIDDTEVFLFKAKDQFFTSTPYTIGGVNFRMPRANKAKITQIGIFSGSGVNENIYTGKARP